MTNKDRSWTEIDLDNFSDNLLVLRKLITGNKSIMQIVKADAYGHGAFQIAAKAAKEGVNFLGVANADEGMLLRYKNIDIPILILSPSLLSEIPLIFENDLIPTVTDQQFAQKLNEEAKKLNLKKKIHINIDSGMGRSGIPLQEGLSFIRQIAQLQYLEIEGIFSHYASSEEDQNYTLEQSEKFKVFIGQLDFKPRYIHIANSSAVVNYSEDYTNLVRLGLLTYGIYSHKSWSDKIELKPVMTFKSYIAQLKTAQKNDSIGYNRTFICTRKTRYAIIPVGYADGYDYLLSNKGKVLINNKLCNVIGKVSMDMITVDVSDLDQVNLMDEVILLGDMKEGMRAEELTSLYQGSSYEILCQIGRRAKRYYKERGEIVSLSPLSRRDFVSYDHSNFKLNRIIESAIEQRLQSKEMASAIFSDFLEKLITEKDLDIHYRRNFRHTVEFRDHNISEMKDYFSVETILNYSKILQNNYFYVACARNEKILENYFLRKDVEYRWLLDGSIELDKAFFQITEAKINDIILKTECSMKNGCLEIYCYHKLLDDLVDKEVDFSICTRTFYPKKYNQLAIYLSEMTRGIEINFKFGDLLGDVTAIPIFSGRNKFPTMKTETNKIKLFTSQNEWTFPVSGVVFTYGQKNGAEEGTRTPTGILPTRP
jgi:alanine racemase